MSESTTYLGNPNLKKINTPVSFSQEDIEEYNKCSKDPLYFIQNFVRIVSLDHGLVPFNMYSFQKDMVNSMHTNRFTIHKLPRQSGNSTIIISYILHYVLFNPNTSVAVLANKSSTARDILGRLQLAYDHLMLIRANLQLIMSVDAGEKSNCICVLLASNQKNDQYASSIKPNMSSYCFDKQA